MKYSDHIKARQMKAARALLDWSQDDLANASGLSVATIRKLELGNISPRGSTMSVIRQAFENAGLEFLDPDGVRHRLEEIKVYQGPEGFIVFFDDVYNSVKKSGGEILEVCASEEPFIRPYAKAASLHIDRMTRIKDTVKVRCILTEDTTYIPCASYIEYRAISKGYVDSVPFYIYDDKFAIIVFDSDPSPKVTVLHSPTVAAAYRRQFESMWDKATPINRLPQSADLSKGKNKEHNA